MSSLFDKFKKDNFLAPFLKSSKGTTKNGGGEGSISILEGNPYLACSYLTTHLPALLIRDLFIEHMGFVYDVHKQTDTLGYSIFVNFLYNFIAK